MSKFATAEFCGWDGEGVTEGEHHRYVTLVSTHGALVSHPGGVTGDATLRLLADAIAARLEEIHVGFVWSYDANMLIRHWPRERVQLLWTLGRVYYDDLKVEYRPRKYFAVYRETGTGRAARWTGGRIWDVWGFFQSSFVQALTDWKAVSPADIAWIAARKKERSRFRPDDLPAMTAYAIRECQALSRLMHLVREAAKGAGVTLRRWDGAGAVASACLQQYDAKAHLGPEPAQPSARWPDAVRDAAQHAYFGGRIEMLRLGHTSGRVWQYDIRSAYPDALRQLPSFAPGTGHWERNAPDAWALPITVAHLRWALREARLYPFPWRAKDGMIYFPPRGEGWYWWPEIRAAFGGRRAGAWQGQLRIAETWSWRPCSTDQPWAWVPAMYTRRAAMKAQGDAAEKILKLGLNSCYGKLAQSVGGVPGRAPPFHCLEAAGWITSFVRARLLRAAVAAGPAAVALATDAVFSTAPIPWCDARVSAALGDWERSEHQSGTWVQAGVYWVGGVQHYRGFDPASLPRDMVRLNWWRGATALPVTSHRFMTMGLAAASEPGFTRWCRWITSRRVLSLVPGAGQKRVLSRPAPLFRRLAWTTPQQPTQFERWRVGSPISAPVALPWRFLDGVPSDTIAADGRADDESRDASE